MIDFASIPECTGEERHFHYDITAGQDVTHVHKHTVYMTDFNRLHHHHPDNHKPFTDEFLESTLEILEIPF